MSRTHAAIAAIVVPLSLAQAQLQISIDPAVRHQTIEGFGAAAAGEWRPEFAILFQQPSFAALLRDDLGLTILRVGVPDNLQPFVDPDPKTLDWSRFNFASFDVAGHLAANLNQDRPGAVKIIGTMWSPPAWMKTNGSVIGGRLRLDHYPHFAKLCAGACLGFEIHYGVPMFMLSPQNEPVFEEPYASCVYSTTEYRDMMRAVATAFTRWNVSSSLFGPEDVAHPQRWASYASTLVADPIAFPRVHALASHHFPWIVSSEWTDPAAWILFRNGYQPLGRPLWSTEVAGEEPVWLGTPERPKSALILANQIHDALVYGDVSAYLYWAITDPTPTQWALMALGEPTKKYYACKQYFRYIRPGAQRIGTSPDVDDTLVSAYMHDADRTMTVVLINLGAAASPVRLTIGGAGGVRGFTTVRSSETENAAVLAPTLVQGGQADLTLPPHTVVTLYGSTCYANCDGSGGPGVLNVGDFVCFQARFAAQDPYADCNLDSALNVGDFVCFQGAFAAGCP